jgi:hypothetical protein
VNDQIPMDRETPRWVERELTHSRHVVGNAKVVVTFSAALAATFVSAALKPEHPTRWDDAAVILMLLTLGLTVCVVLLPPTHRGGELDERAYDPAKRRALWAYWLMVVQVLLSLASIVVVIFAVRQDLLDRIPVI